MLLLSAKLDIAARAQSRAQSLSDRDEELIVRSLARLRASGEALAQPIYLLPPCRVTNVTSEQARNPEDPALQGEAAVRLIAATAKPRFKRTPRTCAADRGTDY